MKRLVFILVGLGGIVALGFYLAQFSEPRGHNYVSETVWEQHPAVITLLISSEKEEWIRKAASEFGRRRPDIDLKLKVMSSVDGLNAILSQQVTPTLWSPVESTMLVYARYRWLQEFGVPPFELTGEDAPQPLAHSAVVWLTWKSRVDAIVAAIKAGKLQGDSVWSELGCAGVPHDPDVPWSGLPARWDALDAFKPTGRVPVTNPMSPWGEVNFLYTDPTRTNLGFHAIYLMTYEFLSKPGEVTKDMLERESYNAWFRRCQRLHKDFPSSVQALTHRLFQFGSVDYDIVVTYENMALQNIIADKRNAEKEGAAKTKPRSEQPYIYYPKVTTWTDHPIVILNSAVLPRDQLEAARDWIAFLLAPERQRSLISFGLRPIRSRPSLNDQRTDNPFLDAAEFGAQLDPAFESPPGPSGETIDHLTDLWRKATGYY